MVLAGGTERRPRWCAVQRNPRMAKGLEGGLAVGADEGGGFDGPLTAGAVGHGLKRIVITGIAQGSVGNVRSADRPLFRLPQCPRAIPDRADFRRRSAPKIGTVAGSAPRTLHNRLSLTE
jgi:hypothetical protein